MEFNIGLRELSQGSSTLSPWQMHVSPNIGLHVRGIKSKAISESNLKDCQI